MTLHELFQTQANSPGVMAQGAGIGTALMGWLTLNNIAIVIGIIATIATCAFNMWIGLKRRKDMNYHYRKSRQIQRGENGDDTS